MLTTPQLNPPAPAPTRGWRRLSAIGVALAFIATLLTGAALNATPANAAPAAKPVGLFNTSAKPKTKAVSSKKPVNLGVKFTTKTDGVVTAIQFYRSKKQKKAYTASLWDSKGRLLARATFAKSSKTGWQTAKLSKPVAIKKGKTYTASYLASDGRFAVTRNGFAKKYTKNGITVAKKGGVYTYSKKSKRPKSNSRGANYLVDVEFQPKFAAAKPPAPAPKPTPTPQPTTTPKPTATPTPTATPQPTATPRPTATATPTPQPTSPSRPSSDWPNASNTGVPAGTTLTTYTGPSTITTNGTVIRNQVVNGSLNIQASNVQIINSRINGTVDLRSPKSNNYSFTITDSEVHIGDNLNTGIMRGNFRATRVEVTGGRRSIYCEYNCVIEDSWVHGQGGDPGGDAHFSGIRMSQNTTLRHNTITCEADRGPGTGCSAGLTGYGDTATVQNNLIENNRFIGGDSTMCAYGGSSPSKPYPNANNIRFINNVFVKGPSGKCGNLGAVASFDPNATGNVWSGNTWDDGTTIRYSD